MDEGKGRDRSSFGHGRPGVCVAPSQPTDPEVCAHLDDNDRMGMTYDEHRRTCGRSLAAPISSPFNRVLGVVSVDAPPDRHVILEGHAAQEAVSQPPPSLVDCWSGK